jgi:RNA polymerase sigma factor (sigma-70 family)
MRKITNDEYNLAYNNLEYKKVMYRVTFRYRKVLDEDERKTAAMLGLKRTLESHDESFGQKFTTSLWRFCDWECKRLLKSKQSFNKNSSKTKSLSYLDKIAVDKTEDTIDVRDCLDKLPSEYRDILKQYYFEQQTMEEIGKINGYSRETARKIINKGLENLRIIMTDNKEGEK